MRKTRNFWESLGYALDGILYAFRTQRNIRIHSLFALGIFCAAGYFHVSRTEWMVLIMTAAAVITLEMVNTAVETVVDLYTEDFLPLAKVAKNVAAGAVLVSSCGAVAIGLTVFAPRILVLLGW